MIPTNNDKMKTKKKLPINLFKGITLLLLLVNCNKNEFVKDDFYTDSAEIISDETLMSAAKIEENTLSFESEELLSAFMERKGGEEFKERLVELSSEGFNSLMPNLDLNDDESIDRYLASKQSRIAKKGYLYSFKNGKDDIDLEDDLISDPDFAAILNEEREIIVGKKFYVYTTNGVYFSHKKHKKHLRKYLKNLASKITSKTQITSRAPCEKARKNNDRKTLSAISFSPVTGSTSRVDSKISLYQTCGGGGGGVTRPVGGVSSNSSTPPMLIPQTFGSCAYSEDSLFQQIFGHTVKCNDYHDSKHRIQTKVWNENYFVWSTVGASAKYQKKRFIGWSESSTSSEVRLGINRAVYTYKSPISLYNPWDPKRVTVKYKGVSYDITGKVVEKYPLNPSAWPFPKNETLGAIEITIFGDDKYWPLKGKDANRSINDLLNTIRSNFRNIAPDIEKDKVGINIVKYMQNSFQITRTDILKKHRSQAKEKFDFNFLLTYNSKNDNFWKTAADQLSAEKYKNIEVDIYGAALRNGKWKGKRITGATN